jgi:hypothetical protein
MKLSNAQLRHFHALEQNMYQLAEKQKLVIVIRSVGENSLLSVVFTLLDFDPQVSVSLFLQLLSV